MNKVHGLREGDSGHRQQLLSHVQNSALLLIVFDSRMKQEKIWLCYNSESFDHEYQC